MVPYTFTSKKWKGQYSTFWMFTWSLFEGFVTFVFLVSNTSFILHVEDWICQSTSVTQNCDHCAKRGRWHQCGSWTSSTCGWNICKHNTFLVGTRWWIHFELNFTIETIRWMTSLDMSQIRNLYSYHIACWALVPLDEDEDEECSNKHGWEIAIHVGCIYELIG